MPINKAQAFPFALGQKLDSGHLVLKTHRRPLT